MKSDPHDPRPFRQWVTFNPDGTVAAMHEVSAGVEQPIPAALEVTDLAPADFHAVRVDPALIATLADAADSVADHQRKLAAAQRAHVEAKQELTQAVADAIAIKPMP